MTPTARRRRAPQARRAARGRAHGQALAELALVTPLLLFLLLTVADVGRLFYTYISVQNAAREGALFGGQHPTCWTSAGACADPANVTYVARQEMGGDTTAAVTVACNPSCASVKTAAGSTITVTVNRPFSFLVADFVLPNLVLGATETAVIQ